MRTDTKSTALFSAVSAAPERLGLPRAIWRPADAVSTRLIMLLSMMVVQWLGAFSYATLAIYSFGARLLGDITMSWALIPKHAIGIIELSGTIAALILVLLRRQFAAIWSELKISATAHPWLGYAAIQLLAFALSAGSSVLLFSQRTLIAGHEAAVSLLWTTSTLTAVIAALAMLAPVKTYLSLLQQYWPRILSGVCLALLFRYAFTAIGAAFAEHSWSNSLSYATLSVAGAVLTAVNPGTTVDPSGFIIVSNGFAVRVGALCSGYEGVFLVVSFLSAYLVLFRRELNIKRALLLIPIAIAASWLLNALRIALLVLLGAHISPDVAISGFHSHAGWIFFLTIAAAFTLVLRTRYFYKTVAPAIRADEISSSLSSTTATSIITKPALLDRETAHYIPLLALLASTLLTSAFSPQFQWLYPLRVLATAAALAYCWRFIDIHSLKVFRWLPVMIGLAVFIMWIVLIPAAPAANVVFGHHLQSVPPAWAFVWIAVRAVGATLTVPLAEELAFRGFLLAALSGQRTDPAAPLRFNIVAMLGSSLLFGALHGQWLAGALAGGAYAIVRYRGQLIDAVLAHAVTNGLLCVYVLAFGQWSYW